MTIPLGFTIVMRIALDIRQTLSNPKSERTEELADVLRGLREAQEDVEPWRLVRLTTHEPRSEPGS